MRPIILSLLFLTSTLSFAQQSLEMDAFSGEEHELKNKIAPSFKTMTLDGKEVSLEDSKGKVVFLDFWSLSCGVCFKELPELNEIVKKYSKEKFILISLMDNTKEELLEKIEVSNGGYKMKKSIFGNDRIDFQIIPDTKAIMNLFSDQLFFPKAFILDRNGMITFYMPDYGEKRGIPDEITSKDMFVKEIDRLIKTVR